MLQATRNRSRTLDMERGVKFKIGEACPMRTLEKAPELIGILLSARSRKRNERTFRRVVTHPATGFLRCARNDERLGLAKHNDARQVLTPQTKSGKFCVRLAREPLI
jgi:hypothetical protein